MEELTYASPILCKLALFSTQLAVNDLYTTMLMLTCLADVIWVAMIWLCCDMQV